MITAVILTLNEERHIAECLTALKWASERLVVDGGSVDQTCPVAIDCGAIVITQTFTNFSEQRNFAMTDIKTPWVLFIDADERVGPELALEIQAVVQSKPAAYQIPRENYFFGKRLKFSGGQRDAPLRLFPRGSGKWVQPVHEYFSTELPVLSLKSHLEHHSTRNLAHYREKMRCYVPLEVETMKQLQRKVYFWDPYLRSVAKFVYLYFFKLGLLDGIVGVQFAALSAYYDFKKWSLYYSWSKLNSRA